MMQKKLLYGASVQGIQGFIFQTNKLKDISGASELVEEICTSEFARMIYQPEETVNATEDLLKEKLQSDSRVLLNAAGNIKFETEDRLLCEHIVRNFPKNIQEKAPGITISQAVVEYNDQDEQSFSQAIIELESRLRIQRNKPMRCNTLGLMGIRRSRNTGLPSVKVQNDKYLDEATLSKLYTDKEGTRKRETINLCKKALSQEIDVRDVAFDIDKITDKNDWIAVIHADGNGLGQIVQRIGHDKVDFKNFSTALDEATISAAQQAFEDLKTLYYWNEIIPIRPVVLGGDDFTVICRADLALDYVKSFIIHFEENTSKIACIEQKRIFTEGRVKDRLTACAGIAYVKSSYPFYYAYDLAEALCSEAKKNAKLKPSIQAGKELPPSCVMFHKLQDSFMDNYEELSRRELWPQKRISFVYGPYYLHEAAAKEHNKWTIDQLQENSEKLEFNNAIKTHLRNWMSLLFDNPELGKQQMKRLKNRLEKEKTKQEISVEQVKAWTEIPSDAISGNGFFESPVYDLLTLHTLNTQNTKRKENKL